MTSFIYNFVANVGRKLRCYFGGQYYQMPYKGFDLDYIGFKYSAFVSDLEISVSQAETYSHTGSRKGAINNVKRFNTYGGLFPHDSNKNEGR